MRSLWSFTIPCSRESRPPIGNPRARATSRGSTVNFHRAIASHSFSADRPPPGGLTTKGGETVLRLVPERVPRCRSKPHQALPHAIGSVTKEQRGLIKVVRLAPQAAHLSQREIVALNVPSSIYGAT